MINEWLHKLKQNIINRLLKDVILDEIRAKRIISSGGKTAYIDLLDLDSRTSNPTLQEGLIWYRSDENILYISHDGSTATAIGSAEQGTFASRPAAGSKGRLYYATDTDDLYYDNGTGWDQWIESVALKDGDYAGAYVGISGSATGRAANLDNIDASLVELFYEHFATILDDDPDMVVTGTVTDYTKLVDNNPTGTWPIWDTINEYAELTFEASAYIKQIRHFGRGINNQDGRFKVQAYINGTWTDVKTGIATVLGVWSSWIDLTTPSSALRWRFVCTTVDTGTSASVCELEIKGVKIG